MKFIATKIPKKKDDKKFTIDVFWISKPILFLKLFIFTLKKLNKKITKIKEQEWKNYHLDIMEK